MVFIFSLFGFDADSDFDADFNADADVDSPDFPLFSVKSITAFLTFFSWTGVLLLREERSLWTIIPYSILSGLVAMALVIFLLKKFSDLAEEGNADLDRKSTRLNSSHVSISYAVLCLITK